MKKILSLFIALLVVISLGIPELFVGNNILPTTVEAASPKLNKSVANIEVGETLKLNVKNTKGKVTWSSSDKTIATVKKGVVKAKSEGEVTITATVKNKKYYCNVSVVGIYINYESTDLSKGQRLELKLACIPGKKVKWKSSNKKIVKVDKSGKIKGIKAGEAKIEAIYKNKTYTCNVRVLGKGIMIFSNDDIDVYYYQTTVSPIDYECDLEEDEITNVDACFQVRNKMDSQIDFEFEYLKLNNIRMDNFWGGQERTPSNSLQTIYACGLIDPLVYNRDNFKVNKISGGVIYYVGGDKVKEHFSKKIK